MLRAWGTGQRVAVDGTLEDIHDDNLIAEQHIRYGRKGGIAYRHIADNYIALFSTFIQCGVWEAIHIIDGLLKNASEVKPNIVHSDTQGQSLPVFAFAYLLGIQLKPRIRNWKDLNLYRVDKKTKYTNIDSMFCEAEIDWGLFETHWQDLIQEGHTITEEDLSHLSPYMTEQIKRFGEYVLDLARRPANLYTTRDKLLFKARNEDEKYAA